jgi:hypothetical protein
LCFSELPNEAIVCRSCGRYQINLEQEYRRVAFKKLLAADRKIGGSFPDRFVRNYSLGYYKIAYTVVPTILGLAVFLLLVQPPLKESGWWPVAFYIVAPLFYFLGWWFYEKYRKEDYERRCNNTVLDYAIKLKNELEPIDLLTFANDDLSAIPFT